MSITEEERKNRAAALGDDRDREQAYRLMHGQTLSGQQMNALAKQYNDALLQIKKDIELRKLALDQAIEYCGRTNISDVIEFAQKMHAFLVEGADDKITNCENSC